jgi:uncharacterized membrane protein YcaP (DUF421 family)
MLDKNFNTDELMAELRTKAGVASLNPVAYAFGLCFGQLNEKQRALVAKIVNEMEKKEDK